jgi:hypothetical protein
MAVLAFLAPVANYLWELFKLWIQTIFVVPFQNTDMLWLLVPVWLGWFFTEFFQEKTGTSMGNAMSNSVIILWACVDCTRQTTGLMAENIITGTLNIIIRFTIITIVFAYGILLVYLGWKGNKLIKRIGRVREVTYLFVIFTPVFYNAINLSWELILAAIIFFPLFYFAIELVDRYTPNPKAIVEDMEDNDNLFKDESIKLESAGFSSPQPPSRQYPQQARRMPPPNRYPQRPQRPMNPGFNQPNQFNRYPPQQNPYNRYNRR